MEDRTTTVDLEDRIDEIEAAQSDIEAEAAALDRDTDEYREHAEVYEELERAKHTIQDCIDEWGGSEFTIKEFSWGDQTKANDLARRDMAADDTEDPRSKFGATKLRKVQVGVVSTPPDAPAHPRGFPPAVGEYLYESITDFNSYGEVGLEDFRLSTALDTDSSPPNS